MIIAIASGKGGTGKTLVATSLVLSLENIEKVQLIDCDVEEPNAHIFLRPSITGSQKVCVPVPVVDEGKCTRCGRCAEVCAFHAIAVFGEHILTFPQLCHGCGACGYLCPEKAIIEEGRESGVVEWGAAGNIDFVHGRLTIGEAMAPPVIREVKKKANDDGTVIIDAPPGTSCPVVTAVSDSDFALLVTEPTPFGLNDLELAVATIREMDIPCGVIVNRAGAGDENVLDYCHKEDIPVLLSIPLDKEIARIYSRGITLAEAMPEWQEKFTGLYQNITGIVNERSRCSKR
jgi:MinD superfamily P-loop ATPase